MNKKLLLTVLLTRVTLISQAAETEKTYHDFAMQRVAIKEHATYSDMSKLTKLAVLEAKIRESTPYTQNVKERRALGALQHRVQQDQKLIIKKTTGAQ